MIELSVNFWFKTISMKLSIHLYIKKTIKKYLKGKHKNIGFLSKFMC